MTARLQMCQQKGFDAVEPDNMDGYANNTGFLLQASDQLAYNEWIAGEAHSLGMAVLEKNDSDQAAALEPYFDGVLDEQCNQYSQCSAYKPYVSAGKPVLNAGTAPAPRSARPTPPPGSWARSTRSTSTAAPTSRASPEPAGPTDHRRKRHGHRHIDDHSFLGLRHAATVHLGPGRAACAGARRPPKPRARRRPRNAGLPRRTVLLRGPAHIARIDGAARGHAGAGRDGLPGRWRPAADVRGEARSPPLAAVAIPRFRGRHGDGRGA
jgi:hypothetical protein